MKEHLTQYISDSRTPEVRGLRILLEYFYAIEIFEKITRSGIKIVSVFGSARTQPATPEYRLAYRVGGLLYRSGFAVVTGASRGVMQAANQGVADAIAQEMIHAKKTRSLEEARKSPLYKKLLKGRSVGLSISLPMESEANPFVGERATFHYFMVRKFFFGSLSSGFIACEGGWGTRDELYEMLTLVQTGKSPVFPIVYLSSDPQHLQNDMDHALQKEYISPEDLHLIDLVTTPEKAAGIISRFYRNVEKVTYDREQGVRILTKKKISLRTRQKVEKMVGEPMKGSFDLEWKGRELVLYQYSPSSYGPLRRAIDMINS